MHKPIMPAIAPMLLFSAGSAAGAEFSLTCAWELGSKFELKISDNGATKNGRAASDQVSISESQITWHEVSLTGADYEYGANRHTGVSIASTFSNTYNRKVENKAICVKSGGSEEKGF
jgi:hypothetical protein